MVDQYQNDYTDTLTSLSSDLDSQALNQSLVCPMEEVLHSSELLLHKKDLVFPTCISEELVFIFCSTPAVSLTNEVVVL